MANLDNKSICRDLVCLAWHYFWSAVAWYPTLVSRTVKQEWYIFISCQNHRWSRLNREGSKILVGGTPQESQGLPLIQVVITNLWGAQQDSLRPNSDTRRFVFIFGLTQKERSFRISLKWLFCGSRFLAYLIQATHLELHRKSTDSSICFLNGSSLHIYFILPWMSVKK